MDRVAVFVDAGYVLACGAILLTGEKSRGGVTLNVPKAIAFLEKFAQEASGLPLLRVYWYDGTDRGPTVEHRTLAHTASVKVRLGIVNTAGEQKGVDSLIVTDMITLARNRSMTDAVLVSGDEDLRVGVQQAQEFGVRVHLLGVEQKFQSQSTLLLQEADQTHMLHKADVEQFLSPRGRTELVVDVGSDPTLSLPRRVARAVLGVLSEEQQKELHDSLEKGRIDIPKDVDRLLLTTMTGQLGRELLPEERKEMRQAFKEEAQPGR